MTAVCALCRQILTGPTVLEVGPDRQKQEFLALAEVARSHLGQRHPEAVKALGAVLSLAGSYLSTVMLDNESAEFRAEQDELRTATIDAVRSCLLVRKPPPAEVTKC